MTIAKLLPTGAHIIHLKNLFLLHSIKWHLSYYQTQGRIHEVPSQQSPIPRSAKLQYGSCLHHTHTPYPPKLINESMSDLSSHIKTITP